MISIAKPDFMVREVFLTCISTVENVGLKQSLTDCIDVIEQAETEFEDKFSNCEIFQILKNDNVLGCIGEAEMKVVYNYRMVKSDMPGRVYYDKIKSSAPFGKCPLCAVRIADTIDHYLPKALFPVYAVTPITLIPACTPCNKKKHIAFPTNSEEQTLHPYYDTISDVNWLKAAVIQSNPIAFDYYVLQPDGWPQILRIRTQMHFDSFELNDIYSAHANEEFRGAKLQMSNRYIDEPAELIKFLNEAYESKLALGLNSWQAVMYKALLDDEWFCSGGVLMQ